VWLSLV